MIRNEIKKRFDKTDMEFLKNDKLLKITRLNAPPMKETSRLKK